MTTDPEWLKAARLLRLDCTEPPETLELEQIARLQYPEQKAWRDRNPLKEALQLDIESGSLPALERTRTVPKWREVPVERDKFMGGDRVVQVDVDYWKSIGGRVREVENGEQEETFRVIERAAFAAWPGLPEAKRSEGIRAWLRPLEQAEEARQGGDAPDRRLRDYVAEVVDVIEAWHTEREKPFDRQRMPGCAGDLLWLMGKLHPEQFGGMAPKAFRSHYAPNGERKICGWVRPAGQQAGAKSTYQEIFPALKHPLASVAAIRK